MPSRELIIEGARQNNLRNVSLSLPHDKIIAVTGVSGSGKSSLAFDTIFAEGQWRFIESLSTYARLFIEKLDRPDADSIRNIRPAIALEQKNPVKGSRSTVGTLTDIYDLLRVLFARIASPFCPSCGKEIRKWDPAQIVSELLEKHRGEKAAVLFESGEPPALLKQKGFSRVWTGSGFADTDTLPPDLSSVNQIVLDRLVIRNEPRLADSVEAAWREGRETMSVLIFKNPEQPFKIAFSAVNACEACGISLPDPSPILFSFNHPVCACPECKGFGNVLKYDEDLIVPNRDLSLVEGAIELWEKPANKWWKEQMLKGLKKSGLDPRKPFHRLSLEEKDVLYKGDGKFLGIDDFFEDMEQKRYKLHVRVLLSRYRSPVTCPRCGGGRLCANALAYRISGLDIAELTEMPVSELIKWFEGIELSPMERDIAVEPLRQIRLKVGFLERVGLGYLTLNRQTKTLSGGEYQRVNLSNQLGSALTGTLYVLDEPTIGLHPRDTERIGRIMRELSDLGNTIVVVEHDRDIIASSDWVVEFGPGGGRLGGEVVFSGPMAEFMDSNTLTAQCLRGLYREPEGGFLPKGAKRGMPGRSMGITGARGNNLKSVDLDMPLNSMTVVSGVSGSGKSSLIVETFYRAVARKLKLSLDHPLPFDSFYGDDDIRFVSLIDQSPIGKTPRSNPLTYLKVFEPIRKLYAKQPEARAHGYTPGFFSFNVPGGRCENCKGEGYEKMEMYFFEDIFVRCEQCKGRRYMDETLLVVYNGKNISDVFDMTVDEALVFFGDIPELRSKLGLVKEIGLGYLRLGQSAPELSGGEAQRLKICSELLAAKQGPRGSSGRGTLYILDEPTIGLHPKDVTLLIGIIRKLVDTGSTVVIIEHNLDVIAAADWVVDLGPDGGAGGGTIIFQGPPEKLALNEDSYTGRYLRQR